MVNKFAFLTICFSIIGKAISWDVQNHPLVLNKKGNELVFPVYVNKAADTSTTIYVEKQDTNTTTYTFCEENSDSVPAKMPFGMDDLYGIPLKDDPNRRCNYPVKYWREPITSSEGKPIPCGGRQKKKSGYKRYKAHVKLQINGEKFSRTLYEYCYDDERNLRTLYTYYKLDNPSLLKNEVLAEEQNFDFGEELVPTTDADVMVYNLYNNETNKKKNQYIAHPVVISEFIPYGHWRGSVNHWQNTAPMNIDLVEPWKLLITKVRSKLAKKTEPIKVFSGIYGVQRANGVIKRFPDDETEIPLVWWILFVNENTTRGVSLLMHNYAYDFGEKRPKTFCEGRSSYCEETDLDDAIPSYAYHDQVYVYCCPAHAVLKFFSIYEGDKFLYFYHDRLLSF